MTAGLHILQARAGCDGTHVVIGGDRAGADDPGLALASLLAEREAKGEKIPTVGLLLRHHGDAAWAEPAVEWLRAHGRRPLIRTAVTLPRHFVQTIRGGDVVVALELAHHRPSLQRALLGPDVDTASSLLLQAQHLEAIGVPVAGTLGPLLPGIHDALEDFDPLLHNVLAADVHHVHLSVGRLTAARLVALSGVVAPGSLISLGRAFGLPPGLLVAPPDSETLAWRLDPTVAKGLYAGLRRRALDQGLSVDACGCPSFCHLDQAPPEGRGYVTVGQPELFADTAV